MRISFCFWQDYGQGKMTLIPKYTYLNLGFILGTGGSISVLLLFLRVAVQMFNQKPKTLLGSLFIWGMSFFVLLDLWYYYMLCSASQPHSWFCVQLLSVLAPALKLSNALMGEVTPSILAFVSGFFPLYFGLRALATLHLSNTHIQTHAQWHILRKWLMVFTQNKYRRNLTNSGQCFISWLNEHRTYFLPTHIFLMFSHVGMLFPLFWKLKSARFSYCISVTRTLYPYYFYSSFC